MVIFRSFVVCLPEGNGGFNFPTFEFMASLADRRNDHFELRYAHLSPYKDSVSFKGALEGKVGHDQLTIRLPISMTPTTKKSSFIIYKPISYKFLILIGAFIREWGEWSNPLLVSQSSHSPKPHELRTSRRVPRRCTEQHGAQGALQPVRLEQPLGAIGRNCGVAFHVAFHHLKTLENLFWQPWHGF